VVAGFASMKGYDYKSAYYRGIESLNNLKEKYDSKAEEPQ